VNEISSAGISPTGARALSVAYGEIFTVPAEKGDIRNLTNSPAAEARDPAWAPDGMSITHFSDASVEYALEIRDQNGLGEPRRIGLGNPPAAPYALRWSQDSNKIAYTDKNQRRTWIWRKGTPVRIDADTYAGPMALDPAWPPDSKWIVYTKKLKSHQHALFVYSSMQGPVTRSVYLAVLTILARPIPARNYGSMPAGKAGTLFLMEAPMVPSMSGPPEGLTLQMFELKTRKMDKIVKQLVGIALVDARKRRLRKAGPDVHDRPRLVPGGCRCLPGVQRASRGAMSATPFSTTMSFSVFRTGDAPASSIPAWRQNSRRSSAAVASAPARAWPPPPAGLRGITGCRFPDWRRRSTSAGRQAKRKESTHGSAGRSRNAGSTSRPPAPFGR